MVYVLEQMVQNLESVAAGQFTHISPKLRKLEAQFRRLSRGARVQQMCARGAAMLSPPLDFSVPPLELRIYFLMNRADELLKYLD